MMGDHWEGLHLGLKLASSAWEKKPDMGKAMLSTQRVKPEKRKIRIKKKKKNGSFCGPVPSYPFSQHSFNF